MSDAVNARSSDTSIPPPVSSSAPAVETRPLSPVVITTQNSGVLSSDSPRPATVSLEKVKELKKKLDELKSPSALRILGAVAAGVFVGLLSLAATCVAAAVVGAVGALFLGVGALFGLYAGGITAVWCFAGTANLCHFIMKTDTAQAEVIEKFAKEQGICVKDVMNALGDLVFSEVSNVTEEQAKNLAGLKEKIAVLQKSLLNSSAETTIHNNYSSPITDQITALQQQFANLQKFIQQQAKMKQDLQVLKGDVERGEQVLVKPQQWGNNPIPERNIFSGTSEPGKKFKPITYEHLEGTTQHMVVELRRREDQLKFLAEYIVKLEQCFETQATLSSQMATAQSAAVVATVPAAA